MAAAPMTELTDAELTSLTAEKVIDLAMLTRDRSRPGYRAELAMYRGWAEERDLLDHRTDGMSHTLRQLLVDAAPW